MTNAALLLAALVWAGVASPTRGFAPLRPPLRARAHAAPRTQRSQARAQLNTPDPVVLFPAVPEAWLLWALGTNALGLASVVITSRYLMTAGAAGWYERLRKPAWFPPSGLFGPVWTLLYSSLGYAAAIVADKAAGPARLTALLVYAGHMAVNLAWPPIFFGMRDTSLALKWSVLLLGVGVLNALKFGAIEPFAGWLFVPYLLWCAFATALTYSLNERNRPELPPGGSTTSTTKY